MSKPLKIIAIAGAVVATVATAGAASPTLAAALGVSAATAATVASIASVASVLASVGAQALAKPPAARGSVSQIIIDPNAPQPYVMGEGYTGGVLRYDAAYGATIKKVPNPYRFMVMAYSGCGPVESISPRVDFAAVPAWYSGFLYTDTQLGACPEADALAPHWSGAPGWGTSSKMSSYAAIAWSLLFDKDGKVFSSGVPLFGAYGKWVKVYDPRKDSTQPGGSGSHRLGVETTYEWSENPALHAGTYAYGRYKNGKRVFGIGLPANAINWPVVAAWANVCDANDWTLFGVIYEGVGAGESERRWDNLKDICFAGGAEPIPGGVLTFKYSAPVVALDTITDADLTDDDSTVVAMQSYRDRINTVIPKYISPDHNWEMVDGEAVVNSTFLAEDGEAKREVWPFNFVKNVAQATQLAAYRMFDTREIPFTLVCKPRLRSYRPGECLYVYLPELGLNCDAIILRRNFDPATMTVTLELISETPEKHAYCLGQTGTAPPTPAIGMTGEQRDLIATGAFAGGAALAIDGFNSDATVANNGVVTASIVNNAVSDSSFAFAASGALLNTSYSDVMVLPVDADGITPVSLAFGLAFYWDNDNGRGEFALYRDSVPLAVFDPNTINSSENPVFSSEYSDVPAAGSYVYRLKAKANNVNKIGVKNRYIRQVELKK